MARSNTFKDVNREDYLRALFRDAERQAKHLSMPDAERAKTVLEFLISHPCNDNEQIDRNGITVRDGHFVIKNRIGRRAV